MGELTVMKKENIQKNIGLSKKWQLTELDENCTEIMAVNRQTMERQKCNFFVVVVRRNRKQGDYSTSRFALKVTTVWLTFAITTSSGMFWFDMFIILFDI